MMTVSEPAGKRQGSQRLSQQECWQYLASATVGRVGFVSPEGVQILPVNYRRSATRLFLKTRPGSLLAQLAEAAQSVAFEVDYHGRDFDLAWSVLMQGALQLLDHDGEQEMERLRLPIEPWPGDTYTLGLQFLPTVMSGRAIQHS